MSSLLSNLIICEFYLDRRNPILKQKDNRKNSWYNSAYRRLKIKRTNLKNNIPHRRPFKCSIGNLQ